jgi:hypothetical protein
MKGATKTKGRARSGSPARRRILLWLSTWGHGETARPGILLTTGDSLMPIPLGFIFGDSGAAKRTAERIILGAPIAEEVSLDLRSFGPDRFPPELAGNLMFPTRPFSREPIDESNPGQAAAMFTPDAAYVGVARFSVLTRVGLEQLLFQCPIIRCGPALEKAMKGFES